MMRAWTGIGVVAVVTGLWLGAGAATTKTIEIGSAQTLHRVEVLTAKGVKIPIEAEDLDSMTVRPIVKMKKRLDKEHYPEFFSANKIRIKPGVTVHGSWAFKDNPNIKPGPYRISIFQISKKAGGERRLRVLRSEFVETLQPLEFRETLIEALEENVFFGALEKVASAGELSPALDYMKSQAGEEVEFRGWGTNWNFSEIKLKLTGVDSSGKEEKLTRDLEEVITDRLIDPQAAIQVRVKNRDLLEDIDY
jgi:hypothetical protein